MSHLGERLSALVDGELDHDARDRVLAHLARCGECRAEAEELRRLKRTLSGLGDPAPTPELARKLCALAEPGPPLPPRPRRVPSRSRGPHTLVFHASRRPPRRPVRRHPVRYAAVSLLTLAVIAFGAAFLMGGGSGGPDTVRVGRSIGRYTVEHAVTAGEVPLTDPAAGAAFTVISTDPSATP